MGMTSEEAVIGGIVLDCIGFAMVAWLASFGDTKLSFWRSSWPAWWAIFFR